LPVVQAPPAGHPGAAAEFLRQHLPGNATAKDEDNPGETRAVRHARPSTLRRRGELGRSRSTRSHSASGISGVATRSTLPPTERLMRSSGARQGRFCYAL
jgi:hypothetical protein